MNKYAKPYDRSCTGKQRLTQDAAEVIAANMRVKTGNLRYHDYPCEVCGAWHVGRARRVEEAGRDERKEVA